MSRFHPRWLDDGHDPEPPAIAESRFRFAHEPSTSRKFPFVGPHRSRGRWLDDAPQPVAPLPFDDDSERPAVDTVPAPKWPGTAYGAAGVVVAVLVIVAMTGNANVAKALIVLPILAMIAHSMARRIAAVAGQPAIVPIMMGGFAVKFIGIMARYFIGLQVYGASDATEYAQWGRNIAPGLRHFHLIDIGKLEGTNFIRLVTGVVFAITPASTMVGFLVFGFMSYIGVVFFWLAFRRAMPNVPDLRYLQILMLLPSMAFWPSAIGKDSWMVMGVGLASFGVANILTNRSLVGWSTFFVGIYAVLAVRPPVGITLMAGLLIAEMFRSRGSQSAGRAMLSVVLLVVIGGLVLTSAKGFLGISNWSKASVDQELGSVANRTGEGRSEFHPTQVNSPVQFPLGVFTVLFRPMPYETHSPQELASSFENLALLGVLAFSAPRLWRAIRRARRRPYLLYCLGVLSTFVVEYSTFSNFAIIARERTQVTALLLVFLFMPAEDPVDISAPGVRPQSVSAPPPNNLA
jgi:hypothetical protein